MLVLNAANFNEEVLQSNIPVMVDFYTNWCGPCRGLKPVLEELSSETAGKYKVVAVDIDDSQELAVEYNINVIPTIVVFENGKEKARISGLRSKVQLLEMFQ